ncbi:MAG TPA: hypothetical protein VFJ51_01145 [Nitrososphaeraceae archaeon]|nr:hypothetical protein [Nitrososphaeraceae archaeon]
MSISIERIMLATVKCSNKPITRNATYYIIGGAKKYIHRFIVKIIICGIEDI